MEGMTPKQVTLLKERVLDDFSYFAQLFTDPSFYDAVFHTELCRFIQHSRKDKLIVLPRTYLKTTIAASLYALWKATRDPTIRILVVSNTEPNAQKTVRSIRSIVEQNSLYHLLFPERVPTFSKVRWSDSCACLARPVDFPEGTFEAAGTGTNIIRRHFNLIIEDDTVAPKKDELTGEEAMPSKDDIEKAVGFHKLTIPLLINEEDERIVIGCLTSDSRVLMGNGTYKNINEVKIGDDVISFSKGEECVCKVEAMIPQGKGKVYRIISNNSTIRATGNHPFLRWDGNEFKFIKVEDLSIGDFVVCYVKKLDGVGATVEGVSIDDGVAWLLGYMFGDGWVSVRKDRSYPIYNVGLAQSIYPQLNKQLEEMFYYYFSAVLQDKGNGCWQVTNKEAGKFFVNARLNVGAKNKRIPQWIYSLPYSTRRCFIKGLVDADGWELDKGIGYGIELANIKLIEDLKHLCSISGCSSSNIFIRTRHIQVPSSSKEVECTTAHIFVYPIDLQHNKDKRYKCTFPYLPLSPEFGLEVIRKIEYAGEEEVFDLTIAGTHNFIANGLVVHNTRWASYDLINYVMENEKFDVYDRNCEQARYKKFSQTRLDSIRAGMGIYMFCTPGNAPILMADGTSKQIKDVMVGEDVVGFVLSKEGDDKNSRLVESKVIAKGSTIAPVCNVYMKSGRIVRCTKDHQWLANLRRGRAGHHPPYRTLESSLRYPLTLHYVCDPVEKDLPLELRDTALWLGGVFDGEGSCTTHLVIAQHRIKHKEVFDKIIAALTSLDFTYKVYERSAEEASKVLKGTTGNCTIVFGTRWEDRRKFLLWCKPAKRDNIISSLYTARFCKEDDVDFFEFNKAEEVFWLQTESGNYINQGYASKNSMLYMNKPLAKEFMAFNPDWFRYYEEEELPEEGDGLVTVDPADPPTGKQSQDYSAIVSVVHTKKGLFIRRYSRKRMTDKQMIDETFDVADKDGIVKIRIETNRYAHLAAAFREAMKIRNKSYIIDEVKAKRINKEARIKNRLSPLFENGVVWMRRGMRELEQELTTFPYGKHDDLIDALSWQVGERTATEYEKEPYKRPALPNGRRVFTLEEIRQSCQRTRQSPYPFARQSEMMPV